MSRKFPFVALLFFLCVCFTIGCKDKAPQAKDSNLTDYELAMTNQDTAAVTSLVDQFFQYVESGDVASAAGMLYSINRQNPLEEPELLDNEELQDVMKSFSSFPIIDHHIDYIKFNEVYLNEVKVSAVIEHAHDGMPEIATVCFFRPYDFQGDWRLCLMESLSGDERIISNNDVDSLQQHYADIQDK